MKKRCHPGGGCVPLPGKSWCAEHQERLDRIRAELDAETAAHSRWAHYDPEGEA